MTESKRRLLSNSRWLLFVVMLMLAVNMTGCMAAYVTFPSNVPTPLGPPQYLPNIKISYAPFYAPFGWQTEYAMSLERIFRSRFHIIDIKQISKNHTSISPDRFVIRPELKEDYSPLAAVWLGVSALSFGVIPGFANQTDHMIFNITAPNGDKKTFSYSYAERSYYWLPFMLFNPDLVFIIMNGGESYEEDRAKIVDAIMTQFMTEATPFILSHSARNLPEDHQ